MIQRYVKCICDICSKETDDELELVRLKVYDSPITSEPKQSIDMCHDCFRKLIESASSYTQQEAKTKFGLIFLDK